MRTNSRNCRSLVVQVCIVGVLSFTEAGGSPYELVARQLLEDECPNAAKDVIDVWQLATIASLEAREHIAGNFNAQNRAAALAHYLAALLELFDRNLGAAFRCPAVATHHLKVVAEWSLSMDQPIRARILVQLGQAFKFQALKEFSNLYHELKLANGQDPPEGAPKRFMPRLHVEYQIMMGQLHESLHVKPSELRSAASVKHIALPTSARIEIHSICSYKPDPTSKTTVDSPLLGLAVPNHQAYSAKHGYRYVVHTESALPDREAHYSKIFVVHQRLVGAKATWAQSSTAEEGPPPDWILYVDCDAFFTNFEVSTQDLISTYAAPDNGNNVNFLVAEDPGGINTGVFLVRNSQWSISFLENVVRSSFTVAWDQSMFFWEIVRSALDMDLAKFAEDFTYPSQVRLIHQAHFNAFVPPASVDWMAYEWRPGDFVRHFAGCPWQEPACLQMMQETATLGPLSREQQAALMAQ
eukprot:TRINITY_DN57272_c0_g1_i1.p1 TRINITY_DN57272_c0_g1~~TRINITY_DN57272_c0_g1_i1.p1  ORF type:complete len:487 (-),score=48.87 TRINITY_DN57272_c0_g1_i1:370-1776(-)